MEAQTNNVWSGQLEERASPYLYVCTQTLVAIGVANDVGDRGVGGGGLRDGSGEDGARDVGRGDAGVVVASEQVDVVLSEVLSVMAVAEKKVGHSSGHVVGMVKDIAASEITRLELMGFVVVLVGTALDMLVSASIFMGVGYTLSRHCTYTNRLIIVYIS
ncbi:hypothetical protein DVH05_010275 [Phytophthora capsici]|nr:hypothetical protein DVH05_010275 [Phytophthora capsici]